MVSVLLRLFCVARHPLPVLLGLDSHRVYLLLLLFFSALLLVLLLLLLLFFFLFLSITPDSCVFPFLRTFFYPVTADLSGFSFNGFEKDGKTPKWDRVDMVHIIDVEFSLTPKDTISVLFYRFLLLLFLSCNDGIALEYFGFCVVQELHLLPTRSSRYHDSFFRFLLCFLLL